MPRNIEIKARVLDMATLQGRARALATEGPFKLFQHDTFFNCQKGRLKLRKFAADRGELIFYQRANLSGPKESFYVRSTTPDPDLLCQSLALAYGIAGQVVKERLLYLIGRTRVHLDTVEGLGVFMELEVVLNENEDPANGQAEAVQLMARLGVGHDQLVESAYIDLLSQQAAQPRP